MRLRQRIVETRLRQAAWELRAADEITKGAVFRFADRLLEEYAVLVDVDRLPIDWARMTRPVWAGQGQQAATATLSVEGSIPTA